MSIKGEASFIKLLGIEEYNKTNNKYVNKGDIKISKTSIEQLTINNNYPPNLFDALIEIFTQFKNNENINLAKQRINNVEEISKDNNTNKLLREKFIEILMSSIKSDDEWKEKIIKEIYEVYINFSDENKKLYKYDYLKLLNILYYLSKNEYDILINLIKVSHTVMLILNGSWKLKGNISFDDLPILIRSTLFQNFNESDKKNFTLNTSASDLVTEYSFLDTARSYRFFEKYDQSYNNLFSNAWSVKFKKFTIIFQNVPSTSNQIKELTNYMISSGRMIQINDIDKQ